MTSRKFYYIVFVCIFILIFARLMRSTDIKQSVQDQTPVVYVLGDKKFSIPPAYLYSLIVQSKGRHIKREIISRYFSIDVLLPDMSPLSEATHVVPPGWGNKVMIYLSNKPLFDTRSVIERTTDGIGVSVAGFTSNDVLKFDRRALTKGKSSGDRDLFIYKDHQLYMSCSKEVVSKGFSPSCTMDSNYYGMHMSATFSVEHKYNFVTINSGIFNLLSSFKQ